MDANICQLHYIDHIKISYQDIRGFTVDICFYMQLDARDGQTAAAALSFFFENWGGPYLLSNDSSHSIADRWNPYKISKGADV